MTENQFYEYLYQQEQRSKTMNEWQPISSAPRDGTEVDVYSRDTRFTDAKFYYGKWHHKEVDPDGCMDWMEIFPQPTHWMPIPKPPTE